MVLLVFDPTGDVFGNYDAYLVENGDSDMDVDQDREEKSNSGEAAVADDKDC
jgi:hypothetical protein